MSASCLFCGRRATHLHHITGRPTPRAPYFDPRLVVPLCESCHHREHVALRRLSLEWPTGDPLRHRCLRTASLARRIADARRCLVLDPSSTYALATLFLEAANAAASAQRVVS
jgi:hypothetical protein